MWNFNFYLFFRYLEYLHSELNVFKKNKNVCFIGKFSIEAL